MREGLWDLPKDFDPLKAVLGEYTDAQQAALDAVLQWGESLQGYLSTIAASGDAEEIRSQADLIRDGVLEQLAAFGITGEAAQEYLELLGLTPEQVETAIKLSGDAEAMFRLQLYADALADKVPPEVWSEVLTLVDEGKLQEAADRLAAWREAESNKPVTIKIVGTPVTGASYGGSSAAAELRGTGASGGGTRPPRRADGGSATADAVVARIRREFGHLPIVDYTAHERQLGTPATVMNAAHLGSYDSIAAGIRVRGGRYPGFARGGRYPVGRDFLVGEEGIEILRIDQPGRVLNNADTRHELTYPGTNVPVGANLVPASGGGTSGIDAKQLLEALRASGEINFDIHMTSPTAADTPRRIAEKVGSRLELAGRR